MGFGSLTVLLAATSGIGWILASQQINTTSYQRAALAQIRAITKYQLDVAGAAVAENSIAFDFSSHSNPSADLMSFDQGRSAVRTDNLTLNALTTRTADRADILQADGAFDAYVAQSNQINADFRTGSPSSLKAASIGVAALAYHTITTPLDKLAELSMTRAGASLAASSAANSMDRLLIVALILGALVLAGGIETLVTSTIISRLRRTEKVLAQIAGGDLTVRLDVDSTDEVGAMGSALNTALEQVERRARAQHFESRLANALEMAKREEEVLVVIERSLSATLPESPTELLIADNSHAHLLRVATASLTGVPPGCCVDSPDDCPAARRSQVQQFADSEALDACPKLRGRLIGAISALCIPVSISGRAVGVIHATGEQHGSFGEGTVHNLGMLAKLAGARIGLLRVMSETQLQASTDSLTGLLNRRSFEEKSSALRRREALFAVAMGDLDHFKLLNDTYGRDTGDRALRLFARALRESVRAEDLVCRHGGEEFVVAMPGCTTEKVREILDALRATLDAAITVAGLPKFNVSFGVVEAGYQEDLPSIVARADAALFQAKDSGRNQIVVQDDSGNTVAPGDGSRRAFGFEREDAPTSLPRQLLDTT